MDGVREGGALARPWRTVFNLFHMDFISGPSDDEAVPVCMGGECFCIKMGHLCWFFFPK